MPNLEIKNNLKEKIKDYQDLIKESEKNKEKSLEKKESFDNVKKQEEKTKETMPSISEGDGQEGIVGSSNLTQQKAQRKKKIENILASDLKEAYLKMTPQKQKEFKLVGEETAIKINNLLDKTKVKIKTIINLIKNWLSIMPGINKFFIEQEAKIKTDEIMKIKGLNDKS